jgi:hypothetical protein
MQSVNFLSKLNLSLSKQQEKDRKIFRYVIIVFGVTAFFFLAALGSNIYLQFRLKQIQAQIKQAQNEVDSERQLEADYLFFVNKLIIIRELFDQRTDKQIAMGYFADLFGPNIRISGLRYNMEEGILSLKVTSPHVFYLEEAFGKIDDPLVREHFATLNKSNLIRSGFGEYSFDLTVSFSDDSELVTIEREY